MAGQHIGQQVTVMPFPKCGGMTLKIMLFSTQDDVSGAIFVCSSVDKVTMMGRDYGLVWLGASGASSALRHTILRRELPIKRTSLSVIEWRKGFTTVEL